jgi:hypothetical protein
MLTPVFPSTWFRIRSSTSGLWADLFHPQMTVKGLGVPDQRQQIFYGLDGVGVGTFPGRDAQPSDHCLSTVIYKVHIRHFVKRIPIHTVVFIITQYKKEFRTTYCSSSSCKVCRYKYAAHMANR